MHGHWICHACWVSSLCLALIGGAVSLSVFSFLSLDNGFAYNTYGYLLSADQCVVAGTALSGYWLQGSLSVEFFGLGADNGTLVRQTIFPLSVCLDAYNPCCKDWIGELLYFQVAINGSDYIVTDMSDTDVENYKYALAGGIVFLVIAAALLASWLVVMWRCIAPMRSAYQQIN